MTGLSFQCWFPSYSKEGNSVLAAGGSRSRDGLRVGGMEVEVQPGHCKPLCVSSFIPQCGMSHTERVSSVCGGTKQGKGCVLPSMGWGLDVLTFLCSRAKAELNSEEWEGQGGPSGWWGCWCSFPALLLTHNTQLPSWGISSSQDCWWWEVVPFSHISD